MALATARRAVGRLARRGGAGEVPGMTPRLSRDPLRRRGALVAMALAGLPALVPLRAVPAQDGPSLVVLVRHAEKAPVPGDDPPISEAGRARAAALAAALRHSGVTAVVVSSRRRTAETAAVLATERGVTPVVVPLDGGGEAHVAAVAEAVRRQRGVVLVVGHSNTVPAIIRALGGPRLPDLCDAAYATLFVLQPAPAGSPAGSRATLTTAWYGAPDSVGADQCAGMVPR